MSFTLNEEFQLRKATLADYKAVFSKFARKFSRKNYQKILIKMSTRVMIICLKFTNNGSRTAVVIALQSYPGMKFRVLQLNSAKQYFLATQDKVVGFFSLSSYKLDDYDVYVEQALRLRADVLGKSISKDAIRWIGDYIKTKSSKPILLR